MVFSGRRANLDVVRIFEGLDYLRGHGKDVAFAYLRVGAHVIAQGLAGDIFHFDIEITINLSRVEDPQDIGMVQPRRKLASCLKRWKKILIIHERGLEDLDDAVEVEGRIVAL